MNPRWSIISWLAYRRGRSIMFSWAGRNPLAGPGHALSIKQEWDSIRGLISARRQPAKIIQKDPEGFTLWETAMGRFWTPPGAGADYVQRLAVEMHSNVYDLTRRRSASNKGKDFIVVDCGANVGFFSRFALQSGASLVVAFEPSPENAKCLRRNLATEIETGRLIVVPKGVWDREAVLSFSTVNVNNPGDHHIVENGEGDVKVPVTSLDIVVKELNLPRVDYIKMDVEGAETRAIAGARQTLLKDRPQLCVATEHTDDMYANTEAVVDAVKAVEPGYKYVCTEVHPYRSPSRGLVLTPFSMLFQ